MNTFIKLRQKYTPSHIKIIFVLESPPEGHGYVYDSKGHTGEVLFRALMKLINLVPGSKEEGLQNLKNSGILLLNPTYKAVNKLPEKQADQIIMSNYQNFVDDLLSFDLKKNIPIILIKSNICRLLEEPLVRDGFNVLNDGLMIPFPVHYHQKRFNEGISKLMKDLNIK